MNTIKTIKPQISMDNTSAVFTDTDVTWSDSVMTWSGATGYWGGYDPKNAIKPKQLEVKIPKP